VSLRRQGDRVLLAIETSCDETSVALVREDRRVLGLLIASQIAEHRPYGGVVPELASRGHLKRILPLLDQLGADAGMQLPQEVCAVAVTAGPGLIGALLVGLETARVLAWLHGKPLIPVHHLHGHLASIHLHDDEQPNPALQPGDWPLVSLIVSGGHTSLVLQEKPGAAPRTLGQTIDDAVGEAYDKVAKLLGLGYPGGPIIDRLVQGVATDRFKLPRPLMDRDNFDFSFSGLKTAVLTQALKITREPHAMDADVKRSLCASFQEAAIDCLMLRLASAIRLFRPRSVAVVGGVASNTLVRQRLAELGNRFKVRTLVPRPLHCTDNAAMIGAAAWEMAEAQPGRLDGFDADEALGLNADANLVLGSFSSHSHAAR